MRRWLVVVLLLASAPALACEVPTDARPLQQRLADVPLAFVGTVRSVAGGAARFQVEQALKGSPGPEYAAAAAVGACSHAFRAGERWLYAGTSLRDPTRRLGEGGQPLARHLERLDDGRLDLTAWQTCDDSAQCVAIDNGCLMTAVHRDHRQAASQRALARSGDPRAMSCETLALIDTVPACVQRRCGAWRLSVR